MALLLALVFLSYVLLLGYLLGLQNKPPAIERTAVAYLVFLFYYFHVQTNNLFIHFRLFVSAITHPPSTSMIMSTKLTTTSGPGAGDNGQNLVCRLRTVLSISRPCNLSHKCKQGQLPVPPRHFAFILVLKHLIISLLLYLLLQPPTSKTMY